MYLYAQELKVWKECAAYRESVRGVDASEGDGVAGDGNGSAGGEGLECRVPGAFEW